MVRAVFSLFSPYYELFFTAIVRTPSYPPTSDIGYALWLRHFAAELPALVGRYGVGQQEVADVQCIAAEFTDWLVYHMHHTTQRQRLSKAPADIAFHFGPGPPVPRNIFLLDRIATLVQRLRAHPAYCLADGCVLGFCEQPMPSAT